MYKGSSLHKWQWHSYGQDILHKQWAASAADANGMDKAAAGFRQGRGRGRFALLGKL